MQERLQKIMARAGLGSRRRNEALIDAGRVRVNGRVARLGEKADPEVDRIEVDGRPLEMDKTIYVKMYKPRGVLSSTEDELNRGRQTVRDVVGLKGHLYPVGRLDKQSEGLMLLTNDGRLTHRLTHPRYGHEKEYLVIVEGRITSATLDLWRAGVILDGRKTAPAQVEVVQQHKDSTWLRVTMHEGRKRQIRRVAASLGHPVSRLIRRRIGPIELGELKPGEWRHLTQGEIASLQRAAYSRDNAAKRRRKRS
jgi:23S rRNA pseudouridine2605 synthase